MRRTYISPEFEYNKVNGTFNMLEQTTFFGSKMLDIVDKIEIKNESVIFYQLSNGEQLNSDAESQLPQNIYDTVDDKNKNHNLILDISQPDSERSNTARWIMDINIKNILTNYIFSNMKKYRTFEGVQNIMTINNNVNTAMYDYIEKNVINRYRLSKIELFLKSLELLNSGALRFKNTYDSNIENKENIFTKFQTETSANELDTRIIFYQPKASKTTNFNYYYNLYFEKI
jgi:hypothetical protein